MFTIADKTFTNRLILGTGKYKNFATMKACYEAARSEMVTLAVRRFAVDAAGAAHLQLAGIPDDATVTLLVSALTPGTRTAAGYALAAGAGR